MKKNKKQTDTIKAKMGDQTFEFEIPKPLLRSLVRRHGNEKPHIHHSKAHPSNNDKICDLCGKTMVQHYHVCEECWKFMKESFVRKIRELEDKVKKLEGKRK